MTRQVEFMDKFWQPGKLFVADVGFQIRTILDSCVSITLWHPLALMGGMSHFLLPTRVKVVSEHELDGRYADEALILMLKDLKAAGVNQLQCRAKVFGGGNMFPEHPRVNEIHRPAQRRGGARTTGAPRY
jgi:chemotaxis protein CheD